MFNKLQQKWKVSGWQVLIILTTFAIGGSLTGYLGRKIMSLIGENEGWFFLPVYIIVITILWPAMVLLVSIPLGQFSFFKQYLVRIGRKMGFTSAPTNNQSDSTQKINIAIFASGAGSNARKIIEHFHQHPTINIALVVCNKPDAGVVQIAANNNIDCLIIEKEQFFRGSHYLPQLQQHQINFIVLAGFLWKIPTRLIASFPNKIINIHPALLPKYGGKGMYGMFVHQAVIEAGERESGITIHFVDEQYDHGSTIFQAACTVENIDTPQTLAEKIHQLEHLHFANIIEQTILQQVQKAG